MFKVDYRGVLHAGFGEVSECLEVIDLSQKILAQVERVDSDIEDASAGELRIHQSVYRIGWTGEVEVCFKKFRVTDGPVLKPLPGLLHGREKAGLHGFHEEYILLFRELAEGAGIDRRWGEGFFAENGLACAKGEFGDFAVKHVGKGDVDDFDFGVVDQGFVAAMGSGEAEILGEGCRAGLVSGSDRDGIDTVESEKFGSKFPGETPRPNQPPSPAFCSSVHVGILSGPA